MLPGADLGVSSSGRNEELAIIFAERPPLAA